ncbi:MAG: hypothetical protein ABGY71_04065 [bacterium]|nr:hypothetical protein [Planctomycetota bacterium]HIL50942.1 hypothetical protein [Planctomycetota bacterium]
MKDVQFSPPEPPSAGLHGNERNKMIAMGILLAMVVGAFVTAEFQKQKHDDAQQGSIEVEPEFTETIVVPEFPAAEKIAAKILDTRPEDRVLLPAEVLDPYIAYTRGLSDAQFEALGVEDLTLKRRGYIDECPEGFRAVPFRIRGYLGDIKKRKRKDGSSEYRGWLVAPTGEIAHFIVSEMAGEPALDNFLRIDGLFLKLFSREGTDGEWAEGPLFVGSRGVRSYPPSEPHDSAMLAGRLALITDDSARQSSGLDGAVFDAQWLLMNYAAAEAKNIAWDDEETLELDNDLMVKLIKNGAAYRGRPIRIPISKNMGIWTESPGENPLRLGRVTTGWIGNWSWANQAGVIKFIMPANMESFEKVELLTAKGFFLKNFNYEPRDGGTRQAPYFVLSELEAFIPVENHTAQNLMYGVMGITLLLLALFPVLLLRDKKKSVALQRDLVRRKQERRRVSAEAAQEPQG